MKRFSFFVAILCTIFLISIIGCPPPDEPTPTRTPTPTPTPVPDFTDETGESTYSGSGDEVFHIATTAGDVDLTHTLHLGGDTVDVYYVFTNTDPGNEYFNPYVDYDKAAGEEYPKIDLRKNPPVTGPYPIFGKPEIDAFNADVREGMKKGEALRDKSVPAPVPFKDSEGQSVTFYYDSTSNTIPATCRAVVTDGTKTLNIYVADDCWTGGSKTYLVTETMVDQMAAKYLQSGSDNDINDWNTTIFGQEWESYANDTFPSTYIPDNNNITILLYDIDGDDVPSGGFIAGFFWSKDNFNDSVYSYSNERIMFYIDAVVYAWPEGGTWEITDWGPAIQISTLAHEGQHMIHFYQKAIASGNAGSNSEAWLNEMCSGVAEDFLSRKMQVSGPRGVDWNTGTAGSSGNIDGRLPLFNYLNDYPLTQWNQTMYNYSTVYAYGAYIARNYGGAELFQEIVQNSGRDSTAIDSALTALLYGEDFSDTLQKWGASELLSDNVTPPAGGYQYNAGTWFSSILGAITYDLGSINLYNYDYGSQIGPYIYMTSPVGDTKHDEFWRASNRLYLVGTGLTGDVTHTVKMEDGVKLTVVVKE